ncbi:MAG: XisI protein [Byssovorax sp.]
MAQVSEYGEIVKQIIRAYGAHPPSVGDIRVEIVLDDTQGHYELIYSGWSRSQRIQGAVLHIDVHDGKVWVEHDGTSPGVANDLLEAGIPASDIVLAFHPPQARKHTEFATG